MLPFQAASTQDIAGAATLDGRRVLVRKVTFNMPVPGLGNQGFAVDVLDGSGRGVQSVGFASQDEAMSFLSSTDAKPYSVIDPMGNRQQETRTGLGIPQGMIVEYQKQQTPPVAPMVASVLPPNAAQYPDAAAAMNAPSDANRQMLATSEQSFNNAAFSPTQSAPVSSPNVAQVSGTVEQVPQSQQTGVSVSQPVAQQTAPSQPAPADSGASNSGDSGTYSDAPLR